MKQPRPFTIFLDTAVTKKVHNVTKYKHYLNRVTYRDGRKEGVARVGSRGGLIWGEASSGG